MRFLVTGATGFIGKKVVDELFLHGAEVITTSRNQESLQKCSWSGNSTHIAHDIATPTSEDLYKKFLQPDRIIHLAWGDLNNYFAKSHLEKQLANHKNFIKNLIENGATHIVGAGTCFEYGLNEGQLIEDSRTIPVTPYGESKMRLQHFLADLSIEFKITYQWLRYFYMFGDGQNSKSLIPLLENAIKLGKKTFDMSGGQQIRDFLPIEKIAKYTVAVALQKEMTGVFNICSGKPVSVLEFVKKYIDSTGININLNLGVYPYPDYEPMSFWGDTEKLTQAIENG